MSTLFLALGDVCGTDELTSMGIAADRRLADRVFGGIAKCQSQNALVLAFLLVGCCRLRRLAIPLHTYAQRKSEMIVYIYTLRLYSSDTTLLRLRQSALTPKG
jgi:hypothetical protein